MGLIKRLLEDRVRKKLSSSGVVLWYDKTGADQRPGYFEDFVTKELDRGDVPLLMFDGSFLALRHALLPIVDKDHVGNDGSLKRPKVLVYVPRERDPDRSPLLDLELMGGQGSVIEGTPWRIIEEALRSEREGLVDREEVKKLVESNFSLDEVDKLTEEKVEVDALVAAVFGSKDPVQIGLSFATDEAAPSRIGEKGARAALAKNLERSFGFKDRAELDLPGMQGAFRNHLLISEILEAYAHEGEAPPGLDKVPLPSLGQLDRVTRVLQQWRDRRDLDDAYVAAARACEEAYGLPARLKERPPPWTLETVECIETLLLADVEASVSQHDPDELLELARERKKSFWGRRSGVGGQWGVLEACADLLRLAEVIQQAVKGVRSFDALVRAYAANDGGEDWFRLDQQQRKLEHHLVQLHGDVPIPKVVARARKAYLDVVDALCRRATDLLEQEGGRPAAPSAMPHTQVYRRTVGPALERGRVAYIFADGLRYEMGQELGERLARHGEVDLQTGLAALPSITPVGMAALLPNADRGFDLRDQGDRFQVRINGEVFDSVQQRVKYLSAASGVPTAEVLLEDIVRKPKETQAVIKDARLVIVRSQDIDELGEGDNLDAAHQMMTRFVERLEQAIVRLGKAGIHHVVVTADHGYHLVETMEEARRLDAPGGTTLDLHRRVWVGRGGHDSEHTLRISAGQLGYSGDFDLVVPRGAAVFRSGGSLAYFHGGVSPQEMVIPVLTAKLRVEAKTAAQADQAKVAVHKERITTGIFLATVRLLSGRITGGEPRKVRVVAELEPAPSVGEARVADISAAGEGVDAATQEVTIPYGQDRQIVFQFRKSAPRTGKLVVRVIDPATEVELGKTAPIDFEQSIV